MKREIADDFKRKAVETKIKSITGLKNEARIEWLGNPFNGYLVTTKSFTGTLPLYARSQLREDLEEAAEDIAAATERDLDCISRLESLDEEEWSKLICDQINTRGEFEKGVYAEGQGMEEISSLVRTGEWAGRELLYDLSTTPLQEIKKKIYRDKGRAE